MKTASIRTLYAATAFLAMALTLTGCKRNKDTQIDPGMTPSNTTGTEATSGDGLPEFSEDMLFTEASGLQKVYFDYDSFDLRPDSLATLKENAEKIKQVPGVVIQIEGHCDERGTQEYNLALGEKRALATRSHLINLGVSGDRLITISYGEEDPADQGHSETSWGKNRRCEFNRAM